MTTHPLAQKPVCESVILYSFPKCGRTWLRYIFLHLYDQHLAAEHFVDLADTRLKIVLVRNILDAMVSYYFEVKYRAGFVGSADRKKKLLDRWLKSDRSMRSFVRSGVADDFLNFYDECARLTGERILVRYEDLQSDTVGTVTRIATRLAPLLGREPSASAIGAAVSACSFESMRALEISGQGIPGVQHMGTWLPNLTPGSLDNPASYKTREGKVGGYTAHLSQDDVRYLANVAQRRDTYRSFYPDVVQDARGAGAKPSVSRLFICLRRQLNRVTLCRRRGS